jgi:hypothetical protein
VHSKSKPLSRKQLADYEATRDLAADLLQSIKEMKARSTPTVTTVSERVEVARTGATVGEKVEWFSRFMTRLRVNRIFTGT